jgi:ParB family chromosome partitioning protein
LELLHLDPRRLVVGVNTRTDAALDKAFLASIAARGVREPIIVRRGEGGVLVVRKGQRRALAAVRAGLELVPVVVEPEPQADQTARDIDRIIDQLGENQHRAGLPVTDEVAAHQQLLDLGLTAGQIARRTHTRPARVKTTLAVGRSGLAAAAMARHDLSLEQAAVIAEFASQEEAVTALVAAAKIGPGQFEHVAQRARDDRTETRLRSELTARLHAAGVTTIQRPDHRGRGAVLGLNQLRPGPHAEPGAAIGEADHAECPGHVAWLENSWRSDQPVAIAYGCRDWVGHGHAERHAPAGQTTTTPPAGAAGGPMNEQQKTERRTVIANNRAWVSATTVRQAWLRQFLTRKSPPKDAQQWIAATLADGSHDLRRAMEDQHSLARDLLGLAETADQRWYRGCGRPHPLAAAAHAATTARATILTLAMLLAALEDGTSNDTWRRPSPESAAYLTTLTNWGYQPSEVEQLLHAHPAHTTNIPHTTGDDPDTESTPDTGDGDVRGEHA